MAGRRVVQVLIGCCLIVALVAPVGGATIPGEPESESPAAETPSISVTPDRTYQTDSTNNSTRHTDPTATGEDGDLRRVKGYLAGRMGEILIDCTEGARAREFGVCGLNESYPDELSKYVNVTREQDDPDENNATETFEQAETSQRSFNDQTQTFTEKLADFREARQNGNTARTRRLARQLRQLATRVNRTGESLDETYITLSNQTGVDTTTARENIDAVQEDILTTAATLTDDLFVRTRLTVQTPDPTASFRDPLTLTGRLATANGTAITDRSIQIRVGDRTIRTRTNDTGRFRLEYRPTTLPLDATTVTARYQPRADSVFLPANDTAPITLTQVTPTVTVATNQSTAQFATPLSLSGTVTAADIEARGVPVALTVGNRRVATVQTNSSGRYQARLRLPATVLNGSRAVEARLALDEQALAPANATTSLRVRTTATNLTITAAQPGAQQILVQGTLATADGTSLAGQRVAIGIGDDDSTLVQTNATGSYTSRIQIPDSVTGSATLTLTGEFTGSETSLQPSRASTSVTTAPPDPETPANSPAPDETNGSLLDNSDGSLLDSSDGSLSNRTIGILRMIWPLLALLAGLAVIGVGGYRVIGRESPTEETNSDSDPGATSDTLQRVTTPESGTETDQPQPSPVDRAQARIATGEVDAAVISVYAMTRARLAARLGLEGSETHWEVVDQYRKTVDADTVTIGSFSVNSALFEQLTQAYERAAFAPVSVSRDSAETLLTDLTELDDDRSTDAQPGD